MPAVYGDVAAAAADHKTAKTFSCKAYLGISSFAVFKLTMQAKKSSSKTFLGGVSTSFSCLFQMNEALLVLVKTSEVVL